MSVLVAGLQKRVQAGRKRVPAEGLLRVAPLTGLPALVRQFGADPGKVFAGAGVDLALMDDPDNTIPFVRMGALVQACADATRCPHLGLLVGAKAGTPVLGIVGYLVQHSPTVGAALSNLIRYLHLHDRGAVPTLNTDARVAVFGYAIYQRDTPGAGHIYDGAIAIAYNILRALCGARWRPEEVLLSRRPPRDAGPYRRFFHSPLRFNAEQTALVFSAEWLEHPLANADPTVYRILRQQVADLETATFPGVAARVRRALRTLVVTGRGSAAHVAARLRLHRRTLNRRLRAENTSFRALLDEARYEVARQLLEDTQMPIGQIATTLGYADASAFTRAFARWTGQSPGSWRKGERAPAKRPALSRNIKRGKAAPG